LRFNLKEEGYKVEWVKNGRQALDEYRSNQYDIIILDIMIPVMDGFEVGKKIRTDDKVTPIIFLTAKLDVKDKVKGLELGADDYITKPFELDELLARIENTLQRKSSYQGENREQGIYTFHNNKVNFNTHKGFSGDQSFELTKRELKLLKYLFQHKGKVVSRQELLKNVWGIDSDINTRTVDNFMARLRKYFEKDTKNPKFFKSIRGTGYMFTDEIGEA